ncbi:MAG: spermidine/putrescine ABC transporter substrate-binding protein [Verrucomicrobiales bacterium]|jgi:spermidine/putrescine transport system substrate-binding protein|nr:spermidine/putrescine ABC transporter substrate-binding protein [Verrucomicrobiales bacterium]MDP4793133.1 spermidine/putrescine ABC transporter substrate-binding protein [Verrucomicrobiales bacterium]MDP4940313.1 spermidine/putrescine ABC transporter substrate-binding protein [Verrucomicrobiales bacterium]MDP5006171.1 spermidine/putrescine ABC transporter substrate-binding protein [Verrucomicrobiales bacterium]
MKYLSLVLLSVLLLTSCGEKKPELHLYTWDDYLNPDLITAFEEKHGCRLIIDIFDSNEAMLAKLKAGATGYDVLVPSSYMVKILAQEKMIIDLDHSKLPNLSHVDDEYLTRLAFDKTMKHSVPYMLAPTGIAWVGDRVENVAPSWAMFNREDLKGRMTLLNDSRETIGAALKFLGHSLNTTDEAQITAAKEVVIGWKRNIAKFESDQYDGGLASSEFFLSQAYAGDAFQAQEDNEAIDFLVPQEGTSIACDDLVISANAPNPELAYAFINFMTEPANAAVNMEYIYYLAPNKTAYDLVSPEFKEIDALFLDDATMAKCEMIDDLGPANALYNKAWDEIRATQ